MSGQTNKPFKQRKSFCKQNKIIFGDFFGAKWFGEGDAMCIGGIIRHPSSLENKYFYALFLSHWQFSLSFTNVLLFCVKCSRKEKRFRVYRPPIPRQSSGKEKYM